MNSYKMLAVGEKDETMIGRPDGYIMDYDRSGFLLRVLLFQPTENELRFFDTDARFEIRFAEHQGVGFFSVKFGGMPWGDCPFSPNIYTEKPEFPSMDASEGFALNVVLIDTCNGEYKKLRLIGLGHKFSDGIKSWCEDSLQRDLSRQEYDQAISNVFARYNSEQLASFAPLGWKLKM